MQAWGIVMTVFTMFGMLGLTLANVTTEENTTGSGNKDVVLKEAPTTESVYKKAI